MTFVDWRRWITSWNGRRQAGGVGPESTCDIVVIEARIEWAFPGR
jgi:hypothetical protein